MTANNGPQITEEQRCSLLRMRSQLLSIQTIYRHGKLEVREEKAGRKIETQMNTDSADTFQFRIFYSSFKGHFKANKSAKGIVSRQFSETCLKNLT